MLLDYLSRMPEDYHFDIAITASKEGMREKEYKKIGCQIFRIPKLRDGILRNFRAVVQIIKKGKYDIVQTHAGYTGIIHVLAAKHCGVKAIIAHSHMAYIKQNFVQNLLRHLITPIVKNNSTLLFSCSKDSVKWEWSANETSDKILIIKNAIDMKQFVFSPEKRSSVRKEYNCGDKLIVGNVGRLTRQKNHDFLLRVFKIIHDRNAHAELWLIGDGEKSDEIKRTIINLNLTGYVRLFGVSNEVNILLNAMDIFVLPSLYEGLGIVLIEAQCNGLPIVATKGVIPEEVHIAQNMKMIPLSLGEEKWAETILESSKAPRNPSGHKQVADAGYDINKAAILLASIYKKVANS